MVVHCQLVSDAKNYPLMYTNLSVACNARGLIGGVLNIVADMDIHLVMNQFRYYVCQEVNVYFIMYF
jgi:hypothetical protein